MTCSYLIHWRIYAAQGSDELRMFFIGLKFVDKEHGAMMHITITRGCLTSYWVLLVIRSRVLPFSERLVEFINYQQILWTQLPLVPHICVGEFGQHLLDGYSYNFHIIYVKFNHSCNFYCWNHLLHPSYGLKDAFKILTKRFIAFVNWAYPISLQNLLLRYMRVCCSGLSIRVSTW